MIMLDDFSINLLEAEFIETIEILNDEYIQWLKDNGYYTVNIFDEASANSAEYFLKQKLTLLAGLKKSIEKMKKHVASQMKSDLEWLVHYKPMLMDMKRFPPKPINNIQRAPNYVLALQRVANPLTNYLTNVNLDKVETDNKKTNSNLYIKKIFIPTFTGNVDFVKFAKFYYYGAEGNRITITSANLITLIPKMLSYCATYPNKILSFETELNGIASFINKNEQGQVQGSSIQDDIMKIRSTKANNNGMASTNPVNNAINVNAATEFFNQYFSDIINETPIQNSFMKKGQGLQIGQQQMTSNQQQQPQAIQVNTALLNNKKRMIVSEIIRDCFNAKLAALGLLYRDFIYVLRKHVASYKGSDAGNAGMDNNQNNNGKVINNQNNQMQK